MLRAELDALPVEEKTGLPYASKVHTKDDSGRDVPVMHACGHDLHMAAFIGTAAIMAHSKESWHGTLMLIGQPAEETIGGAKGMLADGLFTRFPKPSVGVALHVGNNLPAGQVGITPGVYNTNSDSIKITIYGKVVTVLRGLSARENDLPALLSRLKNQCGAGGTLDGDDLEIQGNHLERLRTLLSEAGFTVRG
jgi:hypothetical protein